MKVIGWGEYLDSIYSLTRIVSEQGKFRYVYGIPVHGVIPAVIISQELNINFVNYYSLMLESSKKLVKQEILIIDGVCNSGETLEGWEAVGVTAVLFLRDSDNKIYTPNLSVEGINEEIKFPYEIVDEEKNISDMDEFRWPENYLIE
jgi:hypoxanthine phosphoribosyltransferase